MRDSDLQYTSQDAELEEIIKRGEFQNVYSYLMQKKKRYFLLQTRYDTFAVHNK